MWRGAVVVLASWRRPADVGSGCPQRAPLHRTRLAVVLPGLMWWMSTLWMTGSGGTRKHSRRVQRTLIAAGALPEWSAGETGQRRRRQGWAAWQGKRARGLSRPRSISATSTDLGPDTMHQRDKCFRPGHFVGNQQLDREAVVWPGRVNCSFS